MARALAHNANVLQISLKKILIADDCAILLSEALKTNQVIQSLDLSRNLIGDPGAIALAKALETNRSIQELDLSYNQIGDIGATALASMLENNKSVLRLVLDNNQISPAIMEKIDLALAMNLMLDEQSAKRPRSKIAGSSSQKPAAPAIQKPDNKDKREIVSQSDNGDRKSDLDHYQNQNVSDRRADSKRKTEATSVAVFTEEQSNFLDSLKNLGLGPENFRQLQDLLAQTRLMPENLQDLSEWMKAIQAKLNMLEIDHLEIKKFLEKDSEAQEEQRLIDESPKLRNYQRRLQAELTRFFLCYFLAPAGIFKLEKNNKEAIMSTITALPMGGFLKILTACLSRVIKINRLYQINRVTELFHDLDQISEVCYTFSRMITLSKAQIIEQYQDVAYPNSRLKEFLHTVKEELQNQWKGLVKADKTGVTLGVEERLAVLDTALLLDQILSGKFPIDKNQDLPLQFLSALSDGTVESNQALTNSEVAQPSSNVSIQPAAKTSTPTRVAILPMPTLASNIVSAAAAPAAHSPDQALELKHITEQQRLQAEKATEQESQLRKQAEKAIEQEVQLRKQEEALKMQQQAAAAAHEAATAAHEVAAAAREEAKLMAEEMQKIKGRLPATLAEGDNQALALETPNQNASKQTDLSELPSILSSLTIQMREAQTKIQMLEEEFNLRIEEPSQSHSRSPGKKQPPHAKSPKAVHPHYDNKSLQAMAAPMVQNSAVQKDNLNDSLGRLT